MVVIDVLHTVIAPEEFRRIVGLDRRAYRRGVRDGLIRLSCSGTELQADLRFHSVMDVIEHVVIVFLLCSTTVPTQRNIDYCEDFCNDLALALDEHCISKAECAHSFCAYGSQSGEENSFELPDPYLRFICLLVEWCLRRTEHILVGYIPYRLRATQRGETWDGSTGVKFVVSTNPVDVWRRRAQRTRGHISAPLDLIPWSAKRQDLTWQPAMLIERSPDQLRSIANQKSSLFRTLSRAS